MQYINYIGLVRKVLNVARLSPDECLFIDQPDECLFVDQPDECGRRTSEGRAWSSIRCILEEFRSLSGNANALKACHHYCLVVNIVIIAIIIITIVIIIITIVIIIIEDEIPMQRAPGAVKACGWRRPVQSPKHLCCTL